MLIPLVVLFIISSCTLSNGATQSQPSTSTFQSNTELVSVPVVVKDHYGRRVYGLTQTDFRIFENGHEVGIRSFESVATSGVPTTGHDPANAQTVASQVMGPVPVILFFDQLNTPANEQPEVRRKLALWYGDQQRLAAPTCVVLYTGSVLRIVQQPTVAAAKVQAAIESIPTTINAHGAGASGELPLPAGANENLAIGYGDGPLRTFGRLDYFRDRATGASDTESALIYLGKLFAAWPGEKALVWVTAGPTSNIWTLPLQAERVKIYPLDVHTKIAYEFVASFTAPQTTYQYETEVNNQLLQNLRNAAQETGGELCPTSIEPESCIQRVIEDATNYYLLTYETHSRSNKPELRQIRVKVDRQAVTVSARNSVLVGSTIGTAEEKRERLAAALTSQVDLPGLRLELLPFPPGQTLTLSLLLRSDVEHLGVWSSGTIDFTVVGIVVSGSHVVQHFGEDVHGNVSPKTASDLDRTGLTWTHKIVVPIGASAVRLVVRDNTSGSIGSITHTIP